MLQRLAMFVLAINANIISQKSEMYSPSAILTAVTHWVTDASCSFGFEEQMWREMLVVLLLLCAVGTAGQRSQAIKVNPNDQVFRIL